MSFNATAAPQITTDTSTPADDATVTNIDWFPPIDLAAMREAVRLDGTVTHARLRASVVDAIDEVNRELATWRAPLQASGIAKLADVPADAIGGESIHLSRYRKAVYYLARADLTSKYRDFDSTKSGSADAEELETTICADEKNARNAINDIRGVSRSTIELI
jgi:phage tail protein X